MPTASDVLRIARGEIGYDRYKDPERGTKYGRWYEAQVDKCSTNYDFGANGVAYCAMFASWVLAQAGVKCAGMPGAYCPSIHHKQTLAASQLQPGDLVLFDWEDDGTDDHIGIVVGNDAKAKVVKTIEGNTSGGKVAERTRAYSTVCGGIRPAYDGASQTGSAGVKEITRELVEKVVDGWYGNDPERGKKLTAEGYDYQAVRLAVNAYLRGDSFGAVKPVRYKITTPMGVNVRKEPRYGSPKARDAYPFGKTVEVLATQLDVEGNTWGKTAPGWFAIFYKGKTFAMKA